MKLRIISRWAIDHPAQPWKVNSHSKPITRYCNIWTRNIETVIQIATTWRPFFLLLYNGLCDSTPLSSRHDEKLPSIAYSEGQFEHWIVLQFRGMNEKVRRLRFRVKNWSKMVPYFKDIFSFTSIAVFQNRFPAFGSPYQLIERLQKRDTCAAMSYERPCTIFA